MFPTVFKVNTLVYYGLSFNVDSLAGNLYVNNVINGAVELLAYIMCIALLDRLGRKLMLGGLMIGGGAICIASMLLTEFGLDENGEEIGKLCQCWCFIPVFYLTLFQPRFLRLDV